MTHTKLFAAAAATALSPSAGVSSATAYNPEHPNPIAVENCQANVAKQFELELSGGNGGEIWLQPARADELQQVLRAPRANSWNPRQTDAPPSKPARAALSGWRHPASRTRSHMSRFRAFLTLAV